jgi:hypothetical protein
MNSQSSAEPVQPEISPSHAGPAAAEAAKNPIEEPKKPGLIPRLRERLGQVKEPKKKLVALISLLAVVAAAWLILSPKEGDDFSKLLIDPAYAQDNFEVTATEADSIGVEDTTAFLIRSKDEIEDADVLRGSITLAPAIEFDFEEIDRQNFKVTPKSPLEGRKVYRVAIASAYVTGDGTKEERDYSWAFQVKDIFKVAQTMPRGDSTYVPLDAGIEISFSQDNFIEYEDKIKIEPETKGNFEKHNRTLVFVPEGLLAGTIYTVTVSKDLPVEGSDERLAEDYVFRFETDPAGAKRGSTYTLEMERIFSEFPTGQSPVFGIYQYNSGLTELGVKVYGFKSEEEFTDAISRRAEVPYWASYSRQTYALDTADLTKISEYDLPITSYSDNYQQFFTLPGALPQGYYLVEIAGMDMTRQAFFQVSDIAVYASVTNSDTLVWVHDLKSGNPVEGAGVESADGAKAATDKDGLATFGTGAFFALESGGRKSTFLRVRSGDFASIVPLDVAYGDSDSYYNPASNDYWYYLYTDRSLYMPTDTVNIWGYIKARGGELAQKEMTVRLIENDRWDYYYDPIVISEARAEIKDGTLSGQLKLENVTPGYYTLEFRLGSTVVSTQYVQVQTYTKPAYDVSATVGKKAIFAGEDIAVDAKANFFEGTPVADMDLAYSNSGNAPGAVKTDAAGAAAFTIPTSYRDCSSQDWCYYPNSHSIQVYPSRSEEGEITAEAYAYVFGPKVALRSEFVQANDTRAKVAVQVNKVDLEKINDGTASPYDGFYGAPVEGATVHAQFTEIIYTQVESGTYYDFINKVVRKRYDYKRSEKPAGTFDIQTDKDGKISYELPISLDRSYKVKLSVGDGEGKAAVSTHYLYTFDENDYDYDFYHLAFKTASGEDEEPEFSVGDKVSLKFMNGKKQLSASPGKDFLYYRLQDGIVARDLSAEPAYDFTFEEKYASGVYVEGVWFDGHTYHEARTSGWWHADSLFVRFRKSDRHLNIAVTADKEKYEPGDEVTLKAKVTKDDGSPALTSLNLNLVDEAFYELSQESADTLEEFYGHTMSAGKLVSYTTHEPPIPFSGAEGGGCFTAGTGVLMADGSEKDIENVAAGDEILTFENEFAGKLVKARVAETFRHVVKGYIVINGELEVTPEHRVFVNNGWQMIGEAKIGDILINSRGERVVIRTIERRRETAIVYNLRVEKYATYIAGGIYVHNDKGDERSLFVDNALFSSVATDAQGEAEVKFKLPDNITSWRVTAQGISEDLFAGTGMSAVLVSLPAFATMTSADQYLSSDKPAVKTNSFGTALKSGDAVEFRLEAPTLGMDEKRSGRAFVAEYFDLPQLSAGTHKLSVGLAAGGEKADQLTRFVKVIDSRLMAGKHEYYDLTEGLKLEGSASGRTDLVFTDKERGQFYSMLFELGWTYGDRVDQKLSRVLADTLRNDYFGEGNEAEKFDGQIYQMENGGISLLPYSDADLELTVKVAVLAPQYFDTTALKDYLYEAYGSNGSTSEEVGLSLWGLAALGEPVLIPIQHFTALADISVPAKIYAGLAAFELGDEEAARGIYEGLLENYGEDYDHYVRLRYADDDVSNLQASALLMILGGGLDDRYRDGLWNHVSEQHSDEILTNLEKLLYIQKSLPKLRSGASAFTLQVGGRTEEVKIEKGSSYRLSLTAEELRGMSFTGIDGRIGIVSSFEVPVTKEMENGADPDLSVSRQYFVGGKAADTFPENSLVEIHLSMGIKNDAPGDDFQVTDLLPSGLKILTNPFVRGRSYDYCTRYPYEIDGQEVKFYLGKSWLNNPHNSCGGFFKYYARVVSPGTYTAEPAVIESLRVSDMRNYSSAGKIIITKTDGLK